MEPQIILVGAVVFIVSAVLIYLISAFTMKEKTFEEVMAEQRRQQEEEMAKLKQEKKSEKDTRRRKKTKDKPKGDQSPKPVAVEEVEEPVEHKMVNIELETEVIEPVAPETPLKINKKKEKPAKPILHNKGEKTLIQAEENVEEFIHGPVPKDDIELKKSHGKLDKKKKEKQIQKPVEEEIIQVAQTSVQAAAPSSAEGKVSFKGICPLEVDLHKHLCNDPLLYLNTYVQSC